MGPGQTNRIRARETEVQHFQPAIGRQEQVLGLEIAVHDAAAVRRRQAIGGRERHGEGVAPREGPAGEPGAQGLAMKELGDGVRDVAFVPMS